MAKDFYSQVPKGYRENLEYRVCLGRKAEQDAGLRRAIIAACKHDVLYWLNAFCVLYEPRTRFDSNGRQLPKNIPFITWPHQDTAIREIQKHLGHKDIGIEKSRGEGMSWIGILLAVYDWLFDPGSKIGLVSNTEKKADDPGNMDSLGAKVDFELRMLPPWMVPPYKRNLADHSWVNESNFSQINAFAATSDAGRGGRYKWFLPDELAFWERGQDSRFMASIRGATESRLVISTPNGSDGEYYEFMHRPSNAIRITLDWKDNPTRNRGLYEFQNGKPVAIDPKNNPLPTPYQEPIAKEVLDLFSSLRVKGFKLEGRQRSPWYDSECHRADATPQSIAQELDRDYGGSMFKMFGAEFFEKAHKGAKHPMQEGVLDFSTETLKPEFEKREGGQFRVWCPLDVKKKPPAGHSYIIGCDIGSGLGGAYTSNSVLWVIDATIMEQVAEFAVNTMHTHDFADMAIATCHWFHDAYLIWEHNGPGSGFTNQVIRRQYGNIYRRKVQTKILKKASHQLGWMTNRENKEQMFGEFYRAVKSGELTLRSQETVKECEQYVRLDGRITHVLARTATDDNKGEAHGDRVTAACIALQGVRDRPTISVASENYLTSNPPYGTLAYREKQASDDDSKNKDDWDNRTCDDLASGESRWKYA